MSFRSFDLFFFLCCDTNKSFQALDDCETYFFLIPLSFFSRRDPFDTLAYSSIKSNSSNRRAVSESTDFVAKQKTREQRTANRWSASNDDTVPRLKIIKTKHVANYSVRTFFIWSNLFKNYLFRYVNSIKTPLASSVRYFNANRCLVTKIRRSKYMRHYPTTIVFKDGSTILTRYHEPRALIKLPLILEELDSAEEKQDFNLRRRKIEKIQEVHDSMDVSYSGRDYLKLFKNEKQ